MKRRIGILLVLLAATSSALAISGYNFFQYSNMPSAVVSPTVSAQPTSTVPSTNPHANGATCQQDHLRTTDVCCCQPRQCC